MKKTGLCLALAAALGMTMTACNRTDAPAAGAAAEQPATPATQDNPFFVKSDLPLEYPHFDRIKDSDFAPAFDAGMAEQLKEVEAIAGNAEPATFDNTIEALENSPPSPAVRVMVASPVPAGIRYISVVLSTLALPCAHFGPCSSSLM